MVVETRQQKLNKGIMTNNSVLGNGSTAETHTHNMTDIRAIIPDNFDGDRTKLYDFLQNCSQAYALSTGSQKTLILSYMESKLKGIARAQTRFTEFHSFDDFKTCLMRLFGDKRDFSQILEELNSITQLKNENVQTFYNRITQLQTIALNKIASTNTATQNGKIELINEIALSRLILHSNDEISNALRRSKPTDLNTALSEAIDEEKFLLARRMKTSTFPSKKFCNFCKIPGHLISECRKRQFADSNTRKVNQAVSTIPIRRINRQVQDLSTLIRNLRKSVIIVKNQVI